MKTKKTRKQLLKEAWMVFSQYIKKLGTDWRGYARCYTCDKVMNAETNPSEIHAGHFKHGKGKENYYNPKNCKIQCRQCNFFGGDNIIKQYTFKLIKEIGMEETERLQNSKDKYWSNKDLEYIIKKYKILMSDLG
jgi:hypothetical protein